MAKTPTTNEPKSAPTTKEDEKPSALAQALAIDFTAMNDGVKASARDLYEAYIANSNGLAWDGRPCPKWDDLNNAVKSHWCAVVLQAMATIRGQAQGDLVLLRETIEALKRDLDGAHAQLRDARGEFEKFAETQGESAGLAKLQGELRACRNDLKRVSTERDEANRALARVEASLKTTVHAKAAERCAMLEAEVEKLRVDLAACEATERETSARCTEAETALKKLRAGA